MPLNNIQLNSFHLANMYKNSLVEIEESENNTEKIFTKPLHTDNEVSKKDPVDLVWKYLGDYKKNILLIVNYANAVHLPEEQLNFIISFLGACKLSLADVAILNIAGTPSAIHKDLQRKFASKVTVLFGLTPADLSMPVNFPEFQVQPFSETIFLHTPALEELERDLVLKSKLWVCLRKIFGV